MSTDDRAAEALHAVDGPSTARTSADGYDEVAAALGLAVPPVTPDPRLKERIMAQIAGLPQLPAPSSDGHDADERSARPDDPATGEGHEPGPGGFVGEASAAAPALPEERASEPGTPRVDQPAEPGGNARFGATAPVTPLVPRERSGRPRRSVTPWLLGLAAAAAAVVLFLGGIQVGAGIAPEAPPSAAEQAGRLATLMAASDVQRSHVDDGSTSATLVWSAEQATSAILVQGLDPLPADQVYELWYIGEEGPVPAGTFTTHDGSALHVLDGAMSAGDAVGVTIEPAGGSPVPSGDPVLVLEPA